MRAIEWEAKGGSRTIKPTAAAGRDYRMEADAPMPKKPADIAEKRQETDPRLAADGFSGDAAVPV